MAVTAHTIDQAEWTFVYSPLADGQLRPLPWAYQKIDGTTYVVPLTGAAPGTFRPFKAFAAYQPDRPFPLASSRGARGRDEAPGEVAVHYFTGI